MLSYFFSYLSSDYSFLNVFKYITFRTGLSIFTSLSIVLIFGSIFINYLKSSEHFDQPIRNDGPVSHIIKKSGTPTFGGVLIIFSAIASSVFWADIKNIYVLISIFSILSFSLIGFFDDYLKIKKKNSSGIKAKYKIVLQVLFAIMIVYLIGKEVSYIFSKLKNIKNCYIYQNIQDFRHIFPEIVNEKSIYLVKGSNGVGLNQLLNENF